jgi:hypothetical protein
MEGLLVLLVIVVIGGVFVWKPPRRRGGTPEEILEDAALAKEHDRHRTAAVEAADRSRNG